MNAYPTTRTWMSWEIQSGNFAPLCEWCISSGGRGKCCILCFIQEEKRGKKASRFMEKCRVRRDNKATDAADIVQNCFHSLDRIPIFSKCSLLFYRW